MWQYLPYWREILRVLSYVFKFVCGTQQSCNNQSDNTYLDWSGNQHRILQETAWHTCDEITSINSMLKNPAVPQDSRNKCRTGFGAIALKIITFRSQQQWKLKN